MLDTQNAVVPLFCCSAMPSCCFAGDFSGFVFPAKHDPFHTFEAPEGRGSRKKPQ
jgi:hypothetical protein